MTPPLNSFTLQIVELRRFIVFLCPTNLYYLYPYVFYEVLAACYDKVAQSGVNSHTIKGRAEKNIHWSAQWLGDGESVAGLSFIAY